MLSLFKFLSVFKGLIRVIAPMSLLLGLIESQALAFDCSGLITSPAMYSWHSNYYQTSASTLLQPGDYNFVPTNFDATAVRPSYPVGTMFMATVSCTQDFPNQTINYSWSSSAYVVGVGYIQNNQLTTSVNTLTFIFE